MGILISWFSFCEAFGFEGFRMHGFWVLRALSVRMGTDEGQLALAQNVYAELGEFLGF
jgi:hypothetical protein